MASAVFQTDNVTLSSDTYLIQNAGNQSFHSDEEILGLYNDKVFPYQLPAIVYTAVMMLLGLPGNMVVFYVYFFKWRQSTSRMFILGIAILDMVNCATTLPMEIYIMRNSVKLDAPFLCKITRFSTYAMNSASATILVGIAVDRFIHICRPHSAAFGSRTSLYVCMGSVVSAVVFTWPSLILYGTRELNLKIVTGYACLIQNKFDTTPYPLIYFGFMMVLTMIIFVVIAVLYCLIGVQIYRHRKSKKKKCTHVKRGNDAAEVDQDSGSQYKLASPADKGAAENAVVENNHTMDAIPENMDLECCSSANNGTHNIKVENKNKEMDVTVDGTNTTNETNACDGDLQEPDTNSATTTQLANTTENYVQPQTEGKDDSSSIQTTKRLISATSTSSGSTSPTKFNPKSSSYSRISIKYLLVRGASSFRSSERNKCTKCVTVRIGRSTLMLFLITIAYVLSFVPFYTIIILRQSNLVLLQNLHKGAYHVFLRSYLLSSAINPFIYSFCNVQFRTYCKDLFFHVILRRPQSQAMRKLQRRF